ncbi:MAG: ABC transporter permease [Candidatus Solibacter usitatus]|nr:ABC transporter permease [Candidatus Solibacter usitatus]
MSAVLEPEVVAALGRRSAPLLVPRRRRRTMHAGEFLLDLSRQTLANLRRNKLRSFLTLFGIAWGIASLVLMSALSDGFRQGQRKNMAQIGDNIVFVYGGVTEEQAGGQRAGRRIFLYERDLDVIRANCPAVEVVSAEHKTYQAPARSATNAGRFLTLGVNPDYLKLRNLPVERGRAVSTADVTDARRVAVLGASVRKQLFEKKPVPLGERIFINNYPYEVIGVMSEKDQNSSYDGWDNDKILIPTSALLRDLPASRKVYAEGRIDGFLYRPVSVSQWEEAQAQVRGSLGRIRNFAPQDKGALRVFDSIESAQMFDSIFNAGEIFLAVVSLVTLSLGGVGVMNTMMMAVSERTNEIGLKKALGATSGRILMDFFLEGVFLALLSGAAGLLLTWALSSAVNALPLPAMFSGLPIHWTMLAFATAALGLVAVGSALPPARHAAAMTPVEALRHER